MKQYITPQYIADTIRMFRSQHSGSFLILEGQTDKNFYHNLIDKEQCKIITADFAGKVNNNRVYVIETIAILDRDNFTGALAIIDADFERLEGNLPTSKNILLTDSHDLETMILQSPALDKLLTEYGSEEKLQKLQESSKDVREILIEAGLAIGYLRWLSLKQNLALKFEGLSFSKFIDKDTLAISASQLIKTVKNQSQKLGLDEQQIQNRLDSLKSNEHNPWDVCCGHDLICILSLGLWKLFGSCNSKQVESDVIEKNLRLAYERSHFIQTQLYTAIKEWENVNKLQVLEERI